jgi:protein-S-isoprenylcysteine O-methyltransferase Ste14
MEMNGAAALIARWRVRLGYLLSILVLWFARPTPKSVVLGATIGLFGLGLRAYAAGYLHKRSIDSYRSLRTRETPYLGSAILGLGAGMATWSWISAGILAVYFAVVYTVVMRREEGELFQHHGEEFKAYAAAVPLFLPRLNAARISGASTGAFSLAQYKKNHEYQATLGYLLLLIGLLFIWRLRLH